MKSTIIFLTFIILHISAKYVGNHDGQPNCETDEELTQQKWSNSFDPTHYWLCEKQNEPALDIECPDGQAFLQKTLECVPWGDWVWDEPVEPPSLVTVNDNLIKDVQKF